MDRINIITCSAWVAQGVSNPIIEKGPPQVRKSEENVNKSNEGKKKTKANNVEKKYKDEDEFVEDEYLEGYEFDSDEEDDKIIPTDNLIATCRQEAKTSTLEVYVYNSTEGNLFVHHDILLPEEPPLCMEWLNYNSTTGVSGNLLAIGSMSSVIDVWNLDKMNYLEPEYKLPNTKVDREKGDTNLSHTDAILSLAWNKEYEHLMASGSADKSVIIWDLEKKQLAKRITDFKGKVQSVRWQPSNFINLLTGDCKHTVKLFDCNDYTVSRKFKVDGEVECLHWDEFSYDCNQFLASTEAGTLFRFDIRQKEPLYSFKAHEAACTDFVLSQNCPGCLITVSEDGFIRIWDVMEEAVLVEEKKEDIGAIFTVSSSPDDPFVFCFGGDNKENNFKVWDIRNSLKVRQKFCSRMGLDVNEEEKDTAGWSKASANDDKDKQDFVKPEKLEKKKLVDRKQASQEIQKKSKKKKKHVKTE